MTGQRLLELLWSRQTSHSDVRRKQTVCYDSVNAERTLIDTVILSLIKVTKGTKVGSRYKADYSIKTTQVPDSFPLYRA